MSLSKYPREFLELLESVTAKRPRTVIQHILDHGHVTTEELRRLYGYSHPPRAARDVRELGIPLVTDTIVASDGKTMALYRFGDPSQVRLSDASGRTTFSGALKAKLIEKDGARCNIYLEALPERELQIDHRVPFEISGHDSSADNVDEYMLLCPSANRAKSWSCEHCPNWEVKDPITCRSCYWAYPESYSHVATHDRRRLDIMWAGKEVKSYDDLSAVAAQQGVDMPDYVKKIIVRHLDRGNE